MHLLTFGSSPSLRTSSKSSRFTCVVVQITTLTGVHQPCAVSCSLAKNTGSMVVARLHPCSLGRVTSTACIRSSGTSSESTLSSFMLLLRLRDISHFHMTLPSFFRYQLARLLLLGLGPRLTWLLLLIWHVLSEVLGFDKSQAALGALRSRTQSSLCSSSASIISTRGLHSTVLRSSIFARGKVRCPAKSVEDGSRDVLGSPHGIKMTVDFFVSSSHDAANKNSAALNRWNHEFVLHVGLL